MQLWYRKTRKKGRPRLKFKKRAFMKQTEREKLAKEIEAILKTELMMISGFLMAKDEEGVLMTIQETEDRLLKLIDRVVDETLLEAKYQ